MFEPLHKNNDQPTIIQTEMEVGQENKLLKKEQRMSVPKNRITKKMHPGKSDFQKMTPSTSAVKGSDRDKAEDKKQPEKDPEKLLILRQALENEGTLDADILEFLNTFSSEEAMYVFNPLLSNDLSFVYYEELEKKLLPENFEIAKRILNNRLIEKQTDISIGTPVVDYQTATGGAYGLAIKWATNGKNGYIVQKIEATYEAYDINWNKLPLDVVFTPVYWEAWTIKDSIPQETKGAPQDDIWINYSDEYMTGVPKGTPTRGRWTIKGTVYWVDKLDIQGGGWKKGNPKTDAGEILYSTDKKPAGLGQPIVVRLSSGMWDRLEGVEQFNTQ